MMWGGVGGAGWQWQCCARAGGPLARAWAQAWSCRRASAPGHATRLSFIQGVQVFPPSLRSVLGLLVEGFVGFGLCWLRVVAHQGSGSTLDCRG